MTRLGTLLLIRLLLSAPLFVLMASFLRYRRFAKIRRHFKFTRVAKSDQISIAFAKIGRLFTRKVRSHCYAAARVSRDGRRVVKI